MDLTELQAKARHMVAKRNQAEVDAHRATISKLAGDQATTEYNLALAEDAARHAAPPGWMRDVFGDGKLKPAAQCRVMPLPTEEP